MSFKALVYAYIIGGVTFIPLVVAGIVFYAIYSSVPVNPSHSTVVVIDQKDKDDEQQSTADSAQADGQEPSFSTAFAARLASVGAFDLNDVPKPRKGWLTVRRTFEESTFDGSYVTLMRSFLDARSKDPKRSRPKDMWYVALKGKVLYLYEDEAMTECEAAIELGGHEVVIYPEGLLDGELFAKRNAICLKPKGAASHLDGMPSVTREMRLSPGDDDAFSDGGETKSESQQETAREAKKREAWREEALDVSTPWFIFVRSNIEMEDWYLALIHASDHPPNSPTLHPLLSIFDPCDMANLVETLDEQADVIPMRWFNALIGRIFFSYYRTKVLEEYIIGRLMKKLSKVKRPGFLTEVVVTEVSVGSTAPTFSKPMLKELTKEGDTALEVHLHYKGEVRITVQAVATISLGARLKSYSVKLVLAAVLREIEGNLLIKVKRPPSNRIWYAFTQPPRMVLDVEPVVSDRQITWNMVLGAIETRVKEIIMESVVMPNMDDIAFSQSSDYQHRGGIWGDAVRHEKQTIAETEPLQPTPTFSVEESVPSTTPVPPPSPLAEDMKSALKRARSAEELNNGESPPILDPSLTRAVTSATSSSPPSQSTASKRRTWFSNTAKDADSANGIAESLDRGRVTDITPPSSRSTSTNSDIVDGLDQQNDQFLLPRVPPPLPPRRVSHGSEKTDSSTVTPPTSPQFSRTNTASSITSPSTSFFSTLKARAGDKQALSNSAKEAVRKWSANWGASRREASENVSDTGAQDRYQSDNADHQGKRASYADIRKHVEERHRTINQVDPVDSPAIDILINGTERGLSNPVHVRERRGSRALSISGAQTGTSPLDDPSPLTSSVREDPISAEFHISTNHDTFREADLDTPMPLPIHTQPPQPRTMTIPGIHASHRGEVMSMGYVAESSQSGETKPKTPGIQSVYRLWKNPASSNQPNQETETFPKSLGDPHADSSSQGRSEPISSPPARMIPPPLPPRAISSTDVRPTETPKPVSDNSSSSASAALKSIATQYVSERVSLEHGDVTSVSEAVPAVVAFLPTLPVSSASSDS